MNISFDSLTSLLPILSIVVLSVACGWILARGDDVGARRRRAQR